MPRLPARRYWFSGGVWVALVPFGLSVAFGLLALPAGLPDVSLTLVGLSALATALIWWNSARLEEDKARAAEQIGALVDRLRPSPDLPPLAVQNLGALSSDQLRARVHELAQRMRNMERVFSAAQRQVLFSPGALTSPDDRRNQTDRLLAQHEEQKARWVNDLRPDVIAVWSELRWRVFGPPPYPESKEPSVALEYGSLAGPTPLVEAAEVLESLARRLP